MAPSFCLWLFLLLSCLSRASSFVARRPSSATSQAPHDVYLFSHASTLEDEQHDCQNDDSSDPWFGASNVLPSSSSSSSTKGERMRTMDRRQILTRTAASCLLAAATTTITTETSLSTFTLVPPAHAAYIDATTDLPAITDKVYLDIQIGDDSSSTDKLFYTGRIVIGLFGDLMPRTVQNFKQLCADNAYAGSSFYRVLSDFTIQGGAIGDEAASGQSSSVPTFEPDNFSLRHNALGLVSMVRSNTAAGGADSRFFIQLSDDAQWADDRYAAFGIVLQNGMDTVVKQIAQVPVKRPQNRPTVNVNIVASGVVG